MPVAPESEFALTRHMGGKQQVRPSDRDIVGLARRQHGVVSRTQLIDLGLGEDAIDARLRGGRLFRLHRGVYAVGHGVVTQDGRWLAAVLRIGEGAVLSHCSAAELWGIKRRGSNSRIDVSAPRSTRSPPAIRRHYLQLAPDEMAIRRRVPVTSLARTLVDVASELSLEAFEAVLREAEYVHRFRLNELERFLDRHDGRRGAATIRACLRRLGQAPKGRTRSKLEDRFAAFLVETDLPRPQLNVLIDLDGKKIEADCLWRRQRLIAELDGGEAHGTRSAFESDRERDRHIQVAGWRVIRVTWRQMSDLEALHRDLRRLLH